MDRQIELKNLIAEAVSNANARRMQSLDSEIASLSDEDAAAIKGGLLPPYPIIGMLPKPPIHIGIGMLPKPPIHIGIGMLPKPPCQI